MNAIAYGILPLLLAAIWLTVVHLRVQRRSRGVEKPHDDTR
ncbi:MAG TPA: hypothetical protein VF637_14540 [Sphingomicrobium sp.]